MRRPKRITNRHSQLGHAGRKSAKSTATSHPSILTHLRSGNAAFPSLHRIYSPDQ
jgi:hypothetical protein